ncbi:MAG: zf-HC2 domain-containing protein [Candidatus Methylomirabilales bacterium]
MMRCEQIQGHLSAYLEDEVDPKERRAIEEHLPECVRCRRELELLRRTVSSLTSLEEIEVPPRLTASIQSGVTAQGSSWWRGLTSRLFFPLHIKLPLEAMALILVALGAVYMYRSAPEMAQTPGPPAVTARAPRGRGAAQIAGARRDLDETSALKQSAVKTEASLDDQAEREAFEEAEPKAPGKAGPKAVEERDVGALRFGLMRKEAPSSSNVAPLVQELTLKTGNPSEAASRITEIAATMGGKLLEVRDNQQLILTIPAQEYPKFLTALRELGAPVDVPGEAREAQPSTPQGTLTLHLRLVR